MSNLKKLTQNQINILLRQYFIYSERKRQILAGTFHVQFIESDEISVIKECDNAINNISEALKPYIQIEA